MSFHLFFGIKLVPYFKEKFIFWVTEKSAAGRMFRHKRKERMENNKIHSLRICTFFTHYLDEICVKYSRYCGYH